VSRGPKLAVAPTPTGPALPASPDARSVRWTTVALARRRSLVSARAELEAAEMRGDPLAVVDAWRATLDAIAAAERAGWAVASTDEGEA
jgi:hypothetical protein